MLFYFYYFFKRQVCILKIIFWGRYISHKVILFLFGKFLLERSKVYKKCRVSVLARKPRVFWCIIPHDSWMCCNYNIPVRRFTVPLLDLSLIWNIFNISEFFATLEIAKYSEGNDLGYLWDWNLLMTLLSVLPGFNVWQNCCVMHVLCVCLECWQWCGKERFDS